MVIRNNDPRCLQVLSDILLKRGVVILRCDTMYGITGIAPETRERINSIKRRNQEKSLLQLILDKSWITRFSDIILPPALSGFWPGALTIIIPARSSESVGVRVPDDSFLNTLLYRIDKPLFSTSVNRGGDQPLGKITSIITEFENEVDLIVDSGDEIENIPSTVLDITSIPYKVIRQGRVIIPPGLLEKR